ncbi:MAG: HAD family phosphatase [Bacteroidales bacterium]|nr:HAD family phosphatase [Bacteroidales bacterium]
MNFKPENITNLILDFGGVIYRIDHYKQIEAFSALGIGNFGMLYSHAIQSSLFEQFECGQISPDEMLFELKKLIGKDDLSKEKIYHAWNSILVGFSDQVVKLLKDLRTHYNLYLLSNTNSIHYALFIKEFKENFGLDFDSLFFKTYWSFKIGLRKPGREIYEFVMKDSRLNPEETLFIDDSPQNVKGAIKSGLPALLLNQGMTLVEVFDASLNLKSI